ncbi:MAG TPA: hypothetical protein VGR13_04605 [Actinomycetota bacterium]|jgi:hypothetical protein|nr:hypothetical protein [Actinomycetota bacterium]
MRPIPIPEAASRNYPGFRRVVVAGPSGDLLGDGSSAEKAEPVEALVGLEDRWPVYMERWILEEGELELLQAGGQLELKIYVPQLVVHSLGVVPAPTSDGDPPNPNTA